MTRYAQTIRRLQGVLRDENCARMNQSTVKGYLGELLVLRKLVGDGERPVHRGKLGGYDLAYSSGGYSYLIDVKTSTLKDEVNCGTRYWGWALKVAAKKRPVCCTHFVLLALDGVFEPAQYYVAPAGALGLFGRAWGQFTGVENAFHAPQPRRTYPDTRLQAAFREGERLLVGGHVRRVRPSGSLSQAIRAMVDGATVP